MTPEPTAKLLTREQIEAIAQDILDWLADGRAADPTYEGLSKLKALALASLTQPTDEDIDRAYYAYITSIDLHDVKACLRRAIAAYQEKPPAAEPDKELPSTRYIPKGCPHCGYRHPPDGMCV